MSYRPWWNLEPCGTVAAAKRHYRNGERPCQACREARNRANRSRSWRRAKAESFWRAQDEAAEAEYRASAAWRAEHEASLRRRQERDVRALVALLAEACLDGYRRLPAAQAGERSRAA